MEKVIEYDVLVWMLQDSVDASDRKPNSDELKQKENFLAQGSKWYKNSPSGPQTHLLPLSILTMVQPP